MDTLYRELILEHWKHPQNAGKVDNPDFMMEKFNPYCGDSVAFSGKTTKGVLKEVKFLGKACAIATASASIFTEHVQGMAIDQILKITQEEYLSIVGMELGATRISCSLLVYQTLTMALTSMTIKSDNIPT